MAYNRNVADEFYKTLGQSANAFAPIGLSIGNMFTSQAQQESETLAKSKVNQILEDARNGKYMKDGYMDYEKISSLLMPWDRDLALKYNDMAKQIELKRMSVIESQRKDYEKYDPNSPQYANELLKNKRNLIWAMDQTTDINKKAEIQKQIDNIDATLKKTDYGKAMIGFVGEEAPEKEVAVAPKEVGVSKEVTPMEWAKNYYNTVITPYLNENFDIETGEVKDLAGLKRNITFDVNKAGLAASVAGDIKGYLDDEIGIRRDNLGLKREYSELSRSITKEQKQEERTSSSEKIKQDELYQNLWGALNSFVKSPNDPNKKMDAIMAALRKESGAVIGAEELTAFANLALPPNLYTRFNNEVTSAKSTILGMLNAKAREDYLKSIAFKYIKFFNKQEIYDKLQRKISQEYYKVKEEGWPTFGGSTKPSTTTKTRKRL